MGFHIVKAGILSRLGEAVLQRHGMSYTYDHSKTTPRAYDSL
jgi:hypothetical protein